MEENVKIDFNEIKFLSRIARNLNQDLFNPFLLIKN